MGNPTLVTGALGRTIAVGEFGDRRGYPVVFCHGALASWQYRHPDDTIAARVGVRLITAARPGFGASTRKPGRTVASWAADVAAVVDALEVDRFAVLGHSGGGPHALACAALLGDRVSAVGAAGSLAPLDSDDRFAALGPSGAVFQMAATMPADEFEGGLARVGEMMTANLEMAVRGSIAGDEPDVAGLVDLMIEDGADAFAQGVSGWADELRALTQDWGFALEPATRPVTLLYGETDPLLVQGEDLARLLGGTVTTHPGGHFSFFEQWEGALRAVTASV